MTVLDRVPVEAITAKTPQVDWAHFWARSLRLLVALLALPFVLIGWSAKAVVFAVLWMWSAIAVGWDLGPSSARASEGS